MSFKQQLGQSANLLSAVDAVRNWRAAGLMLVSFFLGGLMFALGGLVSIQVHPALGFVFFLLGLSVVFYGTNAVGILQMDAARGGASRPLLAAVLTSISTGHRFILLMLMVTLAFVVGILIMSLLLLICKVPVLGPLLFAVVFPLCIVVAGVAVFALYVVVGPLAAPAIWDGATTMQGISRLAAIARQRIVTVLLSMMVLLFICAFVGGIIGAMMLTGTFAASSLSAGIIGFNDMSLTPTSMMGALDMSGMRFGDGADSGHIAAGVFGGAIAWAIAFTLPVLVYMRGCCQIYLANIEGVNVEGMEQQLRATLAAAKRRAEEIKAKGEAMAAVQVPRLEPVVTVAPIPAGHLCPSCNTPYKSGDMFCGGCGCKL